MEGETATYTSFTMKKLCRQRKRNVEGEAVHHMLNKKGQEEKENL
jgi:hypothetical protein